MEKKVYKIDVGQIPAEDIDDHLKNVIKKFKKGEYDMTQNYYVQTVPNSHSYGSLENIVVMAKYNSQPTDELTQEHLIIGLNNTLKNEKEIRLVSDINEDYNPDIGVFMSINSMIEFLNSDEYNLMEFLKRIKNTLNGGHDLKSARKMERNDVYKRLDTERDYQDLRWSPRREKNGTPDEQKPPSEWLNYMQKHVNLANDEVYNLNDEEVLAHVRKVAALAVRCLEIHGCPERVIPDEFNLLDVQ